MNKGSAARHKPFKTKSALQKKVNNEMKNAIDFIVFALTHAKPESIPEGAQLPIEVEECGSEPWEYLYGTTGHKISQSLLDERFEHYYKSKGWTREAYDIATENCVRGFLTTSSEPTSPPTTVTARGVRKRAPSPTLKGRLKLARLSFSETRTAE